MLRHKIVGVLIVLVLFAAGCVHGGRHSVQLDSNPKTLGYLQLKSGYSKAAMDEGNLAAIKNVLDHRHRKTGKPYPCWNALKPYKNKNLPVSLSIQSTDANATNSFLALAKLDGGKFDTLGKDGRFSNARPAGQSDFDIWQIKQINRKLSQRKFPSDVVGLVDVSGSMQAKKKLAALKSLRDSNINFKELYTFSDKGTLKPVVRGDIGSVKPTGHTALYDNLAALAGQHPYDEIMVITDGRDNRSSMKLQELIAALGNRNQGVNIVLTGSNAKRDFFRVAQATKGETLTDLLETGEITEPYLEVVLEK